MKFFTKAFLAKKLRKLFVVDRYLDSTQFLTFTNTNVTRAGTKNDFDDPYKLEQFVLDNSGWKVVYRINGKYFIEDILGYLLIRNGSCYVPIPITPNELGLPLPLYEYVLKDRHVATITPENELVPSEYLEDEPLDVEAIQETLKKSRIKLN